MHPFDTLTVEIERGIAQLPPEVANGAAACKLRQQVLRLVDQLHAAELGICCRDKPLETDASLVIIRYFALAAQVRFPELLDPLQAEIHALLNLVEPGVEY